jgi:hypothetical protein
MTSRAVAERLDAIGELFELRRVEPGGVRRVGSGYLGCDRAPTACDLDHTIPYADGGATHASNLKCMCRTHYRLSNEHLTDRAPT